MVELEGQHRGLASALTFKDSRTKRLYECNGKIIGSLEADLNEAFSALAIPQAPVFH